MRTRNLLVFAALFSVAPLSARPAALNAESHESACPYARAAAEAAQAQQTTVTIETVAPEGSLLGAGHRSSAFLP